MVTTPYAALRAARDQLLATRGGHERAVTDFRWPDVGERFNWAHDWFDVIARGNDDVGLVIVEADGSAASYTFGELVDLSDQLAAWFGGKGVRRGDAVLVMLGNQVELWQTMLAIMKLGAVIIPTTTAVGPAELTDRIERGQARFVVCNPDDEQKFAGVAGDYQVVSSASFSEAAQLAAHPVEHPGTSPTDRLLLYFTSGTTSRPKLVEHTQVSYPIGHLSTMYWLGLRPGDVHLNISSPGWAKHAWSCFFAPWLAETTVVVYNYRRFDASALLRVISEQGVTTFCAPPTVWRMLIQADLSGGCGALRELLAAGEPLNPEVIDQVRHAWGLTIRDGYGQTETTALIGNTPGSPVKPGSMGRPLPGVSVTLVDPLTGQETTSEGEVSLRLEGSGSKGRSSRPVNLMAGYQDDQDRQSAAMGGGHYHTGDIASLDADGYLTFIGRTDDVFKSSDYKISPFELESVLLEHPAVAEAAVVPAPDPIRLAVPKAYVALAAGFEPTRQTAYEILRYAREHLPRYQRVRRVEFFELPKTISGKIRRVELRNREKEDAERTDYCDDEFPDLA